MLSAAQAARLEIPLHDGEPIFAEPWQAQAFALAVSLHERGAFGWDEWVGMLSAEIAARPAGPHEAAAAAYYRQWLAALEAIVASKGLASATELAGRMEAWREAHLRTPHGQPVELRPSGQATDTPHRLHAHDREMRHDAGHEPWLAKPATVSAMGRR